MCRVTSCRMNWKSRSRTCAMFCKSPVRRLSIPTTAWPRSSSVSERCEPMKPAAPVITVLGMTKGQGPASGHAALEHAADQSEPHDLEVECHRPVFDVVQVVFDPLLERCISAPAIHLRPAGNAGLHLVAQHVLRDLVLELLDEERALRARADDRHLALEHVPELRQLVEIQPPQPAADHRGARVVV